MAAHNADEQTLETLKRWWDENGRSIVAGITIGIVVILGWRGWNYYQKHIEVSASARYAALGPPGSGADIKSLAQGAASLKKDYPSTLYAALAALRLAKRRVKAGDLKAAAEQLQWVVDHAEQDSLINLAKIRLARVQVSQHHYDKALKTLKGDIPESYTALVEEVRGDALAGKGSVEKAKEAYDRALAAGGSNPFVSMKRDNLAGQAAAHS